MKSISFCHGERKEPLFSSQRSAIFRANLYSSVFKRERERHVSPCTWSKFLYSVNANKLPFNFYNTLPLIKMKERKRPTCDTNGNRKLTWGQSLVFKRSEKYRKWSNICGSGTLDKVTSAITERIYSLVGKNNKLKKVH